MLGIFIQESHRDWVKHLDELTFVINTAVQSFTAVSPVFLNMGRNPKPIVSVRDEIENPDVIDPSDPIV